MDLYENKYRGGRGGAYENHLPVANSHPECGKTGIPITTNPAIKHPPMLFCPDTKESFSRWRERVLSTLNDTGAVREPSMAGDVAYYMLPETGLTSGNPVTSPVGWVFVAEVMALIPCRAVLVHFRRGHL